MSPQLLRVCRSIPLLKLKQGGTLSIRSTFPRTKLKIRPEWRNDGHLVLEQWLPISHAEAEMTVTHEKDAMTSLGRTETHMAVDIRPPERASLPRSEAVQQMEQSETTATAPGVGETMNKKIITDDGTILPDSEEMHDPKYQRVEYSDGVTHVKLKDADEPEHEPSLTLTATVPEKVNLTCNLTSGGDIIVTSKVEGDGQLHTSDGDIRVTKLRGHKLHLSTDTSTSTIHSSDLLEAQALKMRTAGRVRCKRIHGTDIDVLVKRMTGCAAGRAVENDDDDEGSLIDISSLYATGSGGANLYVSSMEPIQQHAVRVKSHHGHVSVDAKAHFSRNASMNGENALVELGGVNGSFDVSVKAAKEGFEELPADETSNWLAARIHVDSLASDSISVAAMDRGNVSLSLDRKLEADLRMLSCSHSVESMEACASLLENDDPASLTQELKKLDAASDASVNDGEERISVQTTAFSQRPSHASFKNIAFVDGFVENKSSEPASRFDVKTKGGKISLAGAASQALKSFADEEEGRNTKGSLPLVALATSGNIVVESLSWLGVIARRYGLVEQDGRESLGRTATRAGRSLAKPTE